MSRWFRFYDGALNDPKVQRLSPPLFKTWINCLCAASQNGGDLPDIDSLAFLLRMQPEELSADMAALISAGLIDETDDGAKPHNWDNRQFVSDSSTPRVKRFRQKKKAEACNVSETADETAPDTEADTETEGSEPNGSGEPSASPVPSVDPKSILFQSGLPILSELTGKPADKLRPVVGRWLKQCGDDAGALLAVIERCRGSPPADPIAWITATLTPRDRPRDQSRKQSSADQTIASFSRILGRRDRMEGQFGQGDAPPWDRDYGPAARSPAGPGEQPLGLSRGAGEREPDRGPGGGLVLDLPVRRVVG